VKDPAAVGPTVAREHFATNHNSGGSHLSLMADALDPCHYMVAKGVNELVGATGVRPAGGGGPLGVVEVVVHASDRSGRRRWRLI